MNEHAGPTTEKDAGRTLGSLGQADLGKIVTIRQGLATIEGVLSEVRHHRGATSMRPVTTVRLLWHEFDTIRAANNHHGRTHGDSPSGDSDLKCPDGSDWPVEVRDEPTRVTPSGSGRDPQDSAA